MTGRLEVVATRPTVPIAGMEASLGQPVRWIGDNDAPPGWQTLGLAVPDVFFVGGHSTPAFRVLAAQARAAGARLVLMSDNDWQGTWRQWLIDPVRYRLLLRRRFDAVLVPGVSGAAHSKAMGFGEAAIFKGLYGADPAVFGGGDAVHKRDLELLFVGQFIERKDVASLAHAFIAIAARNPGWRLRLCGSGPLKGSIPPHERIIVEDFVQPRELAEKLRRARCLVLPSIEEHWGVVVHEAALSGCALALSDAVSAGQDLADGDNSVTFPAGNRPAMQQALETLMRWTDSQWQLAEAQSRERAAQFGPQRFSTSCKSIINMLTGAVA